MFSNSNFKIIFAFLNAIFVRSIIAVLIFLNFTIMSCQVQYPSATNQKNSVAGELIDTNKLSDPLMTLAFEITEYLTTSQGQQTLYDFIKFSDNERKVTNLREFCHKISSDARQWNLSAIDTSMINVLLEELPELLELYPLWRQRSLWDSFQCPPSVVAVVTWDSRNGEDITVQGFFSENAKSFSLTDGQDLSLPVIVIAVPEFSTGNYDINFEALASVQGIPSNINSSFIWEVHFVHVYDDHEPDWAEPPEFYIKANGGSSWTETSITPPVNNTSPWYFTKTIYQFGYSTPDNSKIEIWEDDGWGTAKDDKVEDRWTGGGQGCSIWVDTATYYERELEGCGSGDADVTVQVTAPY